MSSSPFKKWFQNEYRKYIETGNFDILHELIRVTTNKVEEEKRSYDLKWEALQKLKMLEEVTELSALLLYRKAVLLHLNQRGSEALSTFKKILQLPEVALCLQDRSRAYLLTYYKDSLPHKEQNRLYHDLQQTTDSTSLHMLEGINHTLFSEEEDVGNDVESTHYIFTSDERREIPLQLFNEERLRMGHSPEAYDVFLDQIRGQYFIKGQKVSLNEKEVAALFSLVYHGNHCTDQNLYEFIYADSYDRSNPRTKNTLQKYLSRFRTKLKEYGITIQTYRLDPSIQGCLFYEKQWIEKRTFYV